jgi:DNA (cytosine-5)-methyltransferase 1
MPVECERLQGFPDLWTNPSHTTLDPEKLETLRYTALGNAVTVTVAEWLGKRILNYLNADMAIATDREESFAVA